MANSCSRFIDKRHRDWVLELDHLTLPLLFTSQLEVLGPLDGHLSKIGELTKNIFVYFTLEHNLVLPLADGALHPEHQLLGGLRLLPQDGLGLTSKALLLAIVPVMFFLEANHNKCFRNGKRTSFCPGPAWTQRISCTGSP